MQDTVTITTPIGKAEVVIRSFITGRMKQQIQQVFLDASSMDAQGQTAFNGRVVNDATNKALELIVVSVDGKDTDVLDQILDMREQDYEFVKGEVDKIQNPLAQQTAKNSETGSTTPSTEA